MENGKLMQMSPPVELYNKPENLFVANFTGVSNLLKGKLSGEGVALPTGETLRVARRPAGNAGDAVLVAVRPENILLHQNGDASGSANSFPGRVIEGHFHGTQTIYAIETLGHRLEAIELGTVPRFAAQDQIRVVIPPDHSWVFPQ
jgi:iron(III) transport system ATP-binding protein